LGGNQLIYPTHIAHDFAGNLYTSGAFAGTADFDPATSVLNLTANGSEDVFIHKMSYCYPTTNNLTLAVCDSFMSAGNNFAWYNSGNYQDTLTNVAGCDSILYIHLTINHPTYSVITPTACNSYTSPSGHIWTTSGLYHDTIPNMGGCDSAITIFLIINNTVNNVVSVCNTLISNATNATYQWLDCDNNYAILPGETNQMFSASIPGNYAVEITQGGCVDTSACNAITTVGLNETDGTGQSIQLSIYPNPTNNWLSLQTNVLVQSVSIYNTLGSLVQTETKNSFSVAQLAAGIYILQIKTEKGMVNTSFIKE
jgi:Secretion system C-terminal sorting domain